MKTPLLSNTRDEETPSWIHNEWTPFLNHTKDKQLLLALTITLNHARTHLVKVIALPTLGFPKPFHKEFSNI